MKKFIIALVILAFVVLIPPYYIGSEAESMIRDQLAKTNQAGTMTVNLKSYSKGWFGSQATFDFVIPVVDDNSQTEDIEFTLIQTMQHGPLLWNSGGLGFGLIDSKIDFELPEDMKADIDKLTTIDKNTLTITGRTDFDASSKVDIDLKPFVIEEEDATIQVNAGKGSYSYTMEGKVDGQMSWSGLQVKGKDGKKVNISDMTMKMDSQLISGDIYSPAALFGGEFTMSLAQIELVTGNPLEDFKMSELSADVNTDVQPDLTQIKSKLVVKSVNAMAQDFTDIIYDFSIENIDTQVLKEFNSLVAQAQVNQPADPTIMQNKLQAMLPKLVEKKPEIKINQLGMKTPQGEIATNMMVKVNQDLYDANNPMSMIMALDAKAIGQGPEAFFTGLGMGPMIDQLVSQNMLVRNQELLSFEFVYQQGQALMNGSPMPLGM